MHAKADGIEAIAEVRVSTEEEKPKRKETDKQMICWSGDVPPQKWMNFYTKVLSRFASSPALKLTVSFEVPADPEQGKSKADDAKTGLKDLGLDDNIEIT